MNTSLLESYIRSALLIEQQRIDELNLKQKLGLGATAAFMLAKSIFSPALADDNQEKNIAVMAAQKAADEHDDVRLVPGQDGVIEIRSDDGKYKPMNIGYFVVNDKLDKLEDSSKVRSLESVYDNDEIDEIVDTILSVQSSAQSKAQKIKSNINVDDFIDGMIDPDEDNSKRIPYLKANLKKVVLHAESLGLRLEDSSGGSYFRVLRGTKGRGNIKILNLGNNKGVRKVMRQLEQMARR